MRSKVIVIEGLDYAGKTTLARFLKKKYGYSFIPNPGHSPISHEYRATRRGKVPKKIQMLMYSSINLYLYQKAKRVRKHIFFDRFYASTFVYNGKSKKDIDKLVSIHKECIIHKWFFLDISFETFKKRMSIKRNKEEYIYEEYEQQVSKNFNYFRNKYLSFFSSINNCTILTNENKLDIIKNAQTMVNALCDDKHPMIV